MAAVHHRDPSEASCLPPISEILSDVFALPLLSPQPTSGDLPPPLAPSCRPPFGGHPDQSSSTNRAPEVVGVRRPVGDFGGYPCAPNPTGQLTAGQMYLQLLSRTRAVMDFVDVLYHGQRLPSGNKLNEAIANAEFVVEQLHDYFIRRSRRRRTPLSGGCHSCGITDTPEWRRGPNGSRTLCNACGLNYAKLERKRNLQGIGRTDNT
ncbi:hypothetical protein G3M48_004648 [Beauveria asiatica]|uniref:GATA-type domain-containing protein n=1 Tax=Beauveria asiatica TaxID=1069075 RepID=A0AAW0RTH2_9HYPO